MHGDAEHIVQPVADYHCNRLSVGRVREVLEEHGFAVQITHIGTMLKWRFACGETHNQNAYTIFAGRSPTL
jgi:hypothetical protein